MEEKKKFYKKSWFILLVVIIYTIMIIGITYFISITTINKDTLEVGNDNPETQAENKETEQIKEISLKENVKEKDWEITVKETGFKQDINPSNPNSFYTHYQVKDTNNTYFYLIMEAKNVSSLGLKADSIAKVKMKYHNTYEYNTFSAIEESGGGTFSYTNITTIDPLTSRNVYYLVEVPKTISEDDKSVVAEIILNNNTYQLKIR